MSDVPDKHYRTEKALPPPGAVVFDRDDDREGFSAGAGQFDSDITDGRYPRGALSAPEG
jgi:hypothetical protein